MEYNQELTFIQPTEAIMRSSANGELDLLLIGDTMKDCTEKLTSPGATWLLNRHLPIRHSLAQPQVTSFSTPFPTYIERPYKIIPENAKDWEAQKVTLHRLYMEDNLPLKDTMEIMLKKYLFSATERMYKRQFMKWGWRKYNTKGGQQRDLDGKTDQNRGENRSCRRPRRQQPGGWQTDGSTAAAATSNSIFSQFRGSVTRRAMPRLMLHGSETDRWTEGLFVSLYDLMCGSARQSPAWRDTSNLSPIYTGGSRNAFLLFRSAMDLFREGHMRRAGVVLRRAFRDLDALAEEDSCTVFQILILEIPILCYDYAKDRETQLYLHYIWQLFSIKKEGQPIVQIAKIMFRIGSKDQRKLRECLEQMAKIIVDLFAELRGTLDASTLSARYMLTKPGVCENESDLIEIMDDYAALTELARKAYGENCSMVTDMELWHLGASFYVPARSHDLISSSVNLVTKLKSHRPYSWDEWDDSDLWTLSSVYSLVALANLRLQDVKSCICNLEEMIKLLEYLVYEREEGFWRERIEVKAASWRVELAGILAYSGQNSRAVEVISALENLGILTLDDHECTTESIDSLSIVV